MYSRSAVAPGPLARRGFGLPLLPLLLAVGGCATPPASPPIERAVAMPSTRVYFYPAAGQSPAQQDRDRYECYLWAKKQSGFDPGQPPPAPPSVSVAAVPPPGSDSLAGAAAGAVVGAAVSRPREEGEGALVGAVAGALIGASSDAARQEQADRLQQRYDQNIARNEAAALAQGARNFRRAMAACLTGRGYTVR